MCFYPVVRIVTKYVLCSTINYNIRPDAFPPKTAVMCLLLHSGMSLLAPKLCQIGSQIGQIWYFFKDQFHYILARRASQNVLKLIVKSPRSLFWLTLAQIVTGLVGWGKTQYILTNSDFSVLYLLRHDLICSLWSHTSKKTPLKM